jgi:signal transduction histidine kinase
MASAPALGRAPRRTISHVAARAEEAVRAEYMTRRARWLGFGALVVFVLVGLEIRLPRDPALAAGAAALSLAAGLLLVRANARAVLACAALATAGVATLGSGSASNVGWFAVCVLAAWTALKGGRSAGLIFWAASLVLFGAEQWFHHDPGWGAWAVGTTFSTLAALVVQHERSLLEQLRAAQAGLAERSRAEERNRVARELHDVLAHSLTVSLLHVSSARLAVEHDPADAARALEEAERLGRQSLSEVRSIMGMSRPDTGEEIAAPVPRIDGVGELVEQFRRAGADISLSLEGDLTQVPATTGATVYRVAQESLTNAAKHAPGSPVAVRLSAEPGLVELTVDSAGAPRSGAGMGLETMRQRAAAVGGSCAAGPEDEGWRVRATLPLHASPGAAGT